MISEKVMEDAIVNDPEKYLGEKGLKLLERQYKIGNYIFDLLFEDRHGTKLIVEIQRGTLDRHHTYKILDYYDEYKEKNPDCFIELMIIANRIPHERRRRLDAHGVSWKEIPEKEFYTHENLSKFDSFDEEQKGKIKNINELYDFKGNIHNSINEINYENYYYHLRRYNNSQMAEKIIHFINKLQNNNSIILRFKKGGRKVELNLNICLKFYRPNNTFIGLTSSERGFFAWPWFGLFKDHPAEKRVREIFGEYKKAWFNIKPNNIKELTELFNKIEESIRVLEEIC